MAILADLLMGPDGGFTTGSYFLIDGDVTAAYWYGDPSEVRALSASVRPDVCSWSSAHSRSSEPARYANIIRPATLAVRFAPCALFPLS